MVYNARKGLHREKKYYVLTLLLALAEISSRNTRYHHFSKNAVGYKIAPLQLATCNKCTLFLNINQFQERQLLVEW